MNGLEIVELKASSLTDRFLGRKPKENGIREIQNYLAVTPIWQVSREMIDSILSEYQLEVADVRPALINLYIRVLGYFASDHEISDGENEQLEYLQTIFGLSEREIRKTEQEVLLPLFNKMVIHALANKHLADTEKEQLESAIKKLRIPEEAAKGVYALQAHKVLQAELEDAVLDRKLSDEEEERLRAIASSLGVTMQYDQATLNTLDRFRLLWRISQGELPVLDVPILLQRGEAATAVVGANHYELRTVTKRITYSGTRASIRIMKGVRWSVGSSRIYRHTEDQWKHLDSGELYVTNKRLLFNGGKKTTSIQLKKIIDFTCYNNALLIEKDSGKDQLFEFSGDGELLGAVLEAVLMSSRT